jgi:alpha-L-rhamnosidase
LRPTDTPARDERLGWTGDISLFAPTANYLVDTRAFLSHWMADVRNSQYANGDLPTVVPTPQGQFGDSGVGWSDVMITVPYQVWRSYDDTRILRENYPAMQKFFQFVRTSAGADLLEPGRTTFFTNDWLHLDDPTEQGILGTAYYAENARMMAEMAKALGDDAAAADYSRLSADIRDAFTKAYVAADGTVKRNSQTGYALALGMDLVPDPALAEKVGSKFVAKLALTDYHLRTGFIGTPLLLLPALSKIGRDDLAYKMLLHKDYPSWGYEVANGATTMWERWNSIMPNGDFGPVDMNSFNHYAYGAVGDWMFQNIGGLSAIEPGYKRSRIAPVPSGNLTEGSGTLRTVYGRLSSKWSARDGAVDLKVRVPVNTVAEVHVPTKTRWAVTESGRPTTPRVCGSSGWTTGPPCSKSDRGPTASASTPSSAASAKPRKQPESCATSWRDWTLRARRRQTKRPGRSRPPSRPPGPPTWRAVRRAPTSTWTGPWRGWTTSETGPLSRLTRER